MPLLSKDLLWLFLLTTCFCLLGCGGGTGNLAKYSRDTQALETIFPVLEADKITAFRYQDWCKVMGYQRGSYASSLQSTCVYILKADPVEFDAAALADLERVWKKVEATRTDVFLIQSVRFDASGRVAYGEFSYGKGFARNSYVYNPGYTLPKDIPNERWHTAIDANWYQVTEDWN